MPGSTLYGEEAPGITARLRRLTVVRTTVDASKTVLEGKRLYDGRVGANRQMLKLKQNSGYEAQYI
jgi:hypothetical protein